MEIDNVLPSLWRRLLVQFHFTFFYLIELEKKIKALPIRGHVGNLPDPFRKRKGKRNSENVREYSFESIRVLILVDSVPVL